MRDAILPNEEAKLKAVFEATGDWEEAKRAVPAVDPKYLDKGFKEFITGVKEKAPEPQPTSHKK